MKYKNIVAILFGKGDDIVVRFVTSIDRSSKTFRYEAGEEAKTFTKGEAEDLVYGLVCNGYMATIMRVPEHYELRNPEDRGE